MSLTHDEIMRMHDKAFEHGQSNRERASDDLVFYHITQWDDQTLNDSQLAYRGEFNMLKKAAKSILSELKANPVHPDFEPVDETSDDSAELMDGMWRRDSNSNTSKEAFNQATQEAVVCGVGAWELCNEYKYKPDGTKEQYIKRKPIYEANNNLFWDPNAKAIDKHDAEYVSHITAMSPDAYEKMVDDMLGEDKDPVNYASPQQSYVFPWFNQSDIVYVGVFYHREKVTKKFTVITDLFGGTMTIEGEKADEIMDEMLAAGHEIVEEYESECYEVRRYVVDGSEVLEETVVPSQYIPVIPQYGYRAFVESEEVYEGITRDAKDPQRLRNFQMSYLADIMARGPREKPIFHPEQIKGFEWMYEENGIDNNLPYLLQHSRDANGNPTAMGAVGVLPAPAIPPALGASFDLTRQAIDDVAPNPAPQDIADPDLSGKAVYALQNLTDMNNYEYQENRKFAIRRDAEIYADMAVHVYDTPREVMIETPDGTRRTIRTMTVVMDENTMEPVVINDLSNAAFDVYADIGPAYSTQKQQSRDEILQLMQGLPVESEERQILMLQYIMLSNGQSTKSLRKYARNKLIMMGIEEPETREELEMVAQAQQNQQPSAQEQALMMEGQARMMEGQAAIQNEVNDANKIQIDAYNAETNRQKVAIQAQEAGVKIQNTVADTQGKRIDNVIKLRGRAV